MDNILNTLADAMTKLAQQGVYEDMDDMGLDKISVSVLSGDKTVAALVVIRGEDTQALLDALENASEAQRESAEG